MPGIPVSSKLCCRVDRAKGSGSFLTLGQFQLGAQFFLFPVVQSSGSSLVAEILKVGKGLLRYRQTPCASQVEREAGGRRRKSLDRWSWLRSLRCVSL